MEINAYQACPCHLERKIKFCCGKQIVGDLNEVMKLHRAGQSVAGLERLERLIQTSGEKDCLLTLRTHLLLELGETDKARASNEAFLIKNPNHPMGFLHRALIAMASGDLLRATYALQDAMDHFKGTAVPISVVNAYRELGEALLPVGQVFAARAHLGFARQLRPDDQSTIELLRQAMRLPWARVVRKHDPVWPSAPKEPLWSRTFEQVTRLVIRGQWRTAMQYLERKLLPQHPDEPVLRKAVAVLATWLGDSERAVSAWQHYAQSPELPMEQAVEAYLWTSGMRDREATRHFEVVGWWFAVSDLDRLLTQLRSHPRLQEIHLSRDELAEIVAAFEFLDRPVDPALAYSAATDWPLRLAALVLHRGEPGELVLEFRWTEDPQNEPHLATLREVIEGSVDSSTGRRTPVGSIDEEQFVLSWQWLGTMKLEKIRYHALNEAMAIHRACEEWPKVPLRLLDNQAPEAVADQAAFRPQLLAAIYRLALHSDPHPINANTAAALLGKLGLESWPPIDPRERRLETLCPLWLTRVEWQHAADGELTRTFLHASSIRWMELVEKTGRELLQREHLADKLALEFVYQMLAHVVADDDEAMDFMRRARHIATGKGISAGRILIEELELRISRGIEEKTLELAEELATRYRDDPEVAARLGQLMDSRRGVQAVAPSELVDSADDERVAEGAELVESTPAAASAPRRGKLWLPGDP